MSEAGGSDENRGEQGWVGLATGRRIAGSVHLAGAGVRRRTERIRGTDHIGADGALAGMRPA